MQKTQKDSPALKNQLDPNQRTDVKAENKHSSMESLRKQGAAQEAELQQGREKKRERKSHSQWCT